MVRYYVTNDIHNKYDMEEYIASWDDNIFPILPTIGELFFIEDTAYRVIDVCYSASFKNEDGKDIKIGLIDVILTKVEPPTYEIKFSI